MSDDNINAIRTFGSDLSVDDVKDLCAKYELPSHLEAQAPLSPVAITKAPIDIIGLPRCLGSLWCGVWDSDEVLFVGAGIEVKGRRSLLRSTDVLVFRWVGGKHACVDLTGVSPIVGLSRWGFIMGQAALKTASCKVTKHEKSCIKNQHVFTPFAFDTFSFLAPEAVELLNKVERVMNNNVMTPRSTNVVFHQISFAIQKGLAAQLVSRLPSITM
ncbi:hypothetical protein Tco_1093260 [Tanacetum coccineum]|uniref:Uncharacterized protein n=1 Tax=Tanacetum coccineum TaxID=301880 RepID=A0ABQ5IC62_9ASTR